MPSSLKNNFFSVSFEFVPVDDILAYDLYVNSSALEHKDRFVRIFPRGEILTDDDLVRMKEKYHQLYVSESQRSLYLRSMISSSALDDKDKTEIIKDNALHYLENLFESGKEFNTEVLNETIKGSRESVEAMIDVLHDYDINELQKLIASLSFHDFYTYDHSINVSMYNIAFYQALHPKAPRSEVVVVGLGGLLHDLGKIKVPTSIINNPGKLTDDEFKLMKKHPDFGVALLANGHLEVCKDLDLRSLVRVVHEHHENYDGTGYPAKIRGEDIHYMARITAIVDFFDALTTKRSYHEVMTVEEAIHIMAQTKGKKVDPELFDRFSEFVKVMVKKGKFKHQLKDAQHFDSCQPHEAIEISEVKVQKEKEDYGKIKLLDVDSKKIGKVKGEVEKSKEKIKKKKAA